MCSEETNEVLQAYDDSEKIKRKKKARGRRTTVIGQPPLGDGETLRWRALAGALHSELAPVRSPLPQRMLNQSPIHGLNGN